MRTNPQGTLAAKYASFPPVFTSYLISKTHICTHRTAGATVVWYCRRRHRRHHRFHRCAATAATATAAAAAARDEGATAPTRLASNKSWSRQSHIKCNTPFYLRVLVNNSTNSLLLLEQTGMMLTEEIECRAVKDEMLSIPNKARAMPAEPLLTGCYHAALARRAAA